MTMDDRGHEASNILVAKRVSFDDIDEDVLETFIKVKSKYITDGQVRSVVDNKPHTIQNPCRAPLNVALVLCRQTRVRANFPVITFSDNIA